MKVTTIALLTLWSAAVSVTGSKTQKFLENFEHSQGPGENCGAVPSCPDKLPGPINALTWKNLNPTFVHNPRPAGQQAANGVFYADISGNTEPAIISSKYNISCVKSWTLESIGLGCRSLQAIYDPQSNQTYTFQAGANCTYSIVGKNKFGRVVGKERFFYDPGPLNFNNFGFPYWPMLQFATTRRGLKGKDLQTLEISAKVIPGNNPHDRYIGGFGAGIDAVVYTVTNTTRCKYKY